MQIGRERNIHTVVIFGMVGDHPNVDGLAMTTVLEWNTDGPTLAEANPSRLNSIVCGDGDVFNFRGDMPHMAVHSRIRSILESWKHTPYSLADANCAHFADQVKHDLLFLTQQMGRSRAGSFGACSVSPALHASSAPALPVLQRKESFVEAIEERFIEKNFADEAWCHVFEPTQARRPLKRHPALVHLSLAEPVLFSHTVHSGLRRQNCVNLSL